MNRLIICLAFCLASLIACKDDDKGITPSPLPESPIVRIISPTSNSEILDSTIIIIEASDNKGVVKVELFIDNQIPTGGTYTTPPYRFVWNTKNLSDSSLHLLYAKAHDGDGNVSSSSVVNVVAFKFMPDSLSITSISTSEVILHWQDRSRFETGFAVERQRNGGGFVEVIRVGTDVTSWADGSLTKNDTIGYRVRAISGSIMSSYSTVMRMSYSDTGAAFVRTLTGHSGPVRSVAFSPDGTTIASGSYDHFIKLWDVAGGLLQHTLTGHSFFVFSLSFKPDGSALVSAGKDSTTRLWHTGEEIPFLTVPESSEVNTVSYSPDGATIAIGGEDATIRLRRSTDGALVRTMTGHSLFVYSVAFSPDGGTLISGGFDRTIKLWRISDGTVIRTLTGHSAPVASVTFSPDGSTICSASDDLTVRLWNASDGMPLRTFQGQGSFSSVAFSFDGRLIFAGEGGGAVKIWRTADGAPLGVVNAHSFAVYSVAFNSDGISFASGSWDNTIKLWKLTGSWQVFPSP